jgi:hypothetical protein
MTVYVEDPCFKTISKYENIKKVFFKLFSLHIVDKNDKEFVFDRPQLFDFRVEEDNE